MSSVVICILSGARKGQEIRLESDVFRAGDTPGCEVYFDPRLDSAVRGRSATVRLGDDGWYVRPGEPGRMLLNQAPVAGEIRIRSGDVVRMSEAGPDFLFTIASRPTETVAASHRLPSATSRDLEHVSTAGRSADVATSPVSSSEAEPAAGSQFPQAAAHGSSPPIHRVSPWKWAVWLGAGLAAVLLVASVGSLGVQRRTTGATDGDPEVTRLEAISGGTIEEKSPPTIEPTGEKTVKADEAQTTAAVAESDPWVRVQAEVRESLFLVQVEADGPTGSYSWPFATCSAIDHHTVLTSAREVLQLATWQRQGCRIWVTCPSTGLKEPVKDFRVHREFAQLAETPGDWIYVNLGLLITSGELPKPVSLASPGDLRQLEEGLPVACFGISHEGNKITRFDTFQPQLCRGQVYLISSRGASSRPELLEVKARIPENVFGSPIVNQQGRVIAVYGEAAPTGEIPVKDLHYASIVDSALLKSWMERPEAVWVSPSPSTKH